MVWGGSFLFALRLNRSSGVYEVLERAKIAVHVAYLASAGRPQASDYSATGNQANSKLAMEFGSSPRELKLQCLRHFHGRITL